MTSIGESPNYSSIDIATLEVRGCQVDEPPVIAMLQEAIRDNVARRSLNLPAASSPAILLEWLKDRRAVTWAVASNSQDIALYLLYPNEDSEVPNHSGYWSIFPFVLPEYRGLGVVYRTIHTIHAELAHREVVGLHAFSWQSDHSSTRLWRKLGYESMGRFWDSEGEPPGWRLMWAFSIN